MQESRTLTIDIRCPLDRAYAFLSRPENLPQWAAGLGSGIAPEGNKWVIQTPAGPAVLQFADLNPFGVLDHTVHAPDGRIVHVPMRVVANGEGCQVALTLFRPEGFTDRQYADDIRHVQNDLETLKKLLER